MTNRHEKLKLSRMYDNALSSRKFLAACAKFVADNSKQEDGKQ